VGVWVCGCVGVWVCGCVGVWAWFEWGRRSLSFFASFPCLPALPRRSPPEPFGYSVACKWFPYALVLVPISVPPDEGRRDTIAGGLAPRHCRSFLTFFCLWSTRGAVFLPQKTLFPNPHSRAEKRGLLRPYFPPFLVSGAPFLGCHPIHSYASWLHYSPTRTRCGGGQ
jgi:hypothetical protein